MEEQLKQKLRRYYNQCEVVNELLDAEDIDIDEANELALELDERYAKRIIELLKTAHK